ncbi:MAG: hypothetical protein RLZZ31_1408 [Actinomycetota bacterium]
MTQLTTSFQSWVETLNSSALAALVDALDYEFSNPALVRTALTHRSWCAENPGHHSNERLEFLGDAVLGLVITDELFSANPDQSEGALAKARAAVVNERSLCQIANEIGVGPALFLGRGEIASGGREKSSILADATEALFGAIYIDGGFAEARRVVLLLLAQRAALAASDPGVDDFKSQLQEFIARHYADAPVYEIDDSGPDHNKRFAAKVLLDGVVIGIGEGRTKKSAEQSAASVALLELKQRQQGSECNA